MGNMTWYPSKLEFAEVTDIFGFANWVTNGAFSLLTLLAIWIISFAYFKKYETKIAIAGSTTLTFLLSIPLTFIKYNNAPLLAPQITVALLILTGICGLWLWKSD